MATRDEMSMYGIYGREQEGYSIAGSSRHERLPQGGGVHNRHHSDGGGVLSSAIQGGRGMVSAKFSRLEVNSPSSMYSLMSLFVQRFRREETLDNGETQALISTPLLSMTISPTLLLENSSMIQAMILDHIWAAGQIDTRFLRTI